MQIIRCTELYVPALRKFIDEYWVKGHILSSDIDVLRWYYSNSEGGCNFLLAIQDGQIYGILGYIDSEKFSASHHGKAELWLALWKVRDDSPTSGIGLRLVMSLKKMFPDRLISVIGLSNEAKKIYQLLGYTVAVMRHLFIYNKHIASPKLLKGNLPDFNCYIGDVFVEKNVDIAQMRIDAPFIKDSRGRHVDYFVSRYIENPFRYYDIFRVKNSAGNVAYVVTRMDALEDAKALRIVDVFGEFSVLSEAIFWFKEYIESNNLEYMDIYVYADDIAALESSGLIDRHQLSDEVVVPNYFSPYVAKNIDLECAFQRGFTGPIFKADGDQERPSRR